MIKKYIFALLFFIMIPFVVSASGGLEAKVGDRYYETLEEAILNATSSDTITLISNVQLEYSLDINKTVNINLNNNNISSPTTVFNVQDGVLNISGRGTIKELEPNYGAIMLKGSSDSTDTEYSVVNIGSDVTLEGWSGIFINHELSKAYGVVVNLDGKISAVNDINGGSGVGVYVNGNIKHQDNAPIINILDNAEIVSSGNGLYIAGYSTFNIGKSYISGIESGIGIKSGILNIDGATVICEGKDNTPTEGYNNGINASGAAIQIESNSGYAGKIQLNISKGNFKSKNSNVIYEYIGKGSNSLIYSMSISGGSFISEASKDVFKFSDSFNDIHSGFISGGEYSSNPNSYLKSGYTTIKEDDLFVVTKNTIKTVISHSINNSNNSFLEFLIISALVIILFVLLYFNRVRILNLLKKFKQ